MRCKSLIMGGILALASGAANAGQAHTTYRISNAGATVTTSVANASVAQAKLAESYLFDSLAKNLKSFNGITAIEVAGKRSETIEDFEDAREYIRHYPVRVKLSAPNAVTLTFQVEESYRHCKPGYACSPSAYLKVSSGHQQDVWIDVQHESKDSLTIVSNYAMNSIILGGKGNSERTTIVVAAARALRVSNERMVE